ncbi:MAG: DUF1207 domain-containing protein, partial [Simkaniaceae bacterium]|nr:DUF1207 domain-containing protein [Simkaniaceae bacterium]
MTIKHLLSIVSVFLIGCASSIANEPFFSSNAPTRTDSIPVQHVANEEDAYLEGYIQALVNANYYEFDVLVYVENGDVYLYNLPKNELIKNSIISFVSDIPDVKSVSPVDKFPGKKLETLEKREVKPQIKGVWFPQQTVLYPPMIANPRATIYSAAYHIGDNVIGNKSIAVSLGDNFPIFRWRNVLPWQGDLQIDIQAGIWSVFKMGIDYNGEISELVNTDYLVGFPLSYAFDKWAFQLRAYHVSCHLGDEFLVHNPGIKRVNPSMEALDLFTSYQINSEFRVYAGFGWVFHSDKTYPIKPPLYLEWGGEARLFGRKFFYHRLYGT